MLKSIIPLRRFNSILANHIRCFSSSSAQSPGQIFGTDGRFIEDKRFLPVFNENQRVKPPYISNSLMRKYCQLPEKRNYRKSNYYSVIKGDLIWHVFDLEGYSLGRAATQIAKVLLGKYRPISKRDVVNDKDRIVVVNCDNPKLTGKKLFQKKYYKHSGYPGGLKVTPVKAMLQSKKPESVLIHAVAGMLPKIKNKNEHLKFIYTFPGQFHTFHQLGLPQFAYAQVPDLNKEVGFDALNPDDFEVVMASPDFSEKVMDISQYKQSNFEIPELPENFEAPRSRVYYKREQRIQLARKKRLERRYRIYHRR